MNKTGGGRGCVRIGGNYDRSNTCIRDFRSTDLSSSYFGRENLIDQIVYITSKEREEYSELSTYELATELKIVKIQAGL